jgi:hypothetical protein
MLRELSSLEFALDDTIGGHRLTPQTIDLPTLRGFLGEVEKLIKGDVPGASLNDSRVRIEEGSVKVIALVAHLLADDVRSDLSRLETTGDLDQIQPHRAEVIEQWQNRARNTPSRSYTFLPQPGAAALRVTNATQLQHGSENAWVSVEKYLTGKVVNAGGKQEPNIHLILTDSGESVRVNATEQQLAAERENQLYKVVTLRVMAQQHLRTHALRDLRLIELLPISNEADERALERLWERGREAWKDVRSAAGWVESVRGNS